MIFLKKTKKRLTVRISTRLCLVLIAAAGYVAHFFH
jgi:hypothetical protein